MNIFPIMQHPNNIKNIATVFPAALKANSVSIPRDCVFATNKTNEHNDEYSTNVMRRLSNKIGLIYSPSNAQKETPL